MRAFKITILFTLTFTLFSCEKYLDIAPDAEVSESDVFGTYQNFQGFLNPLYQDFIDYNNFSVTTVGFHADFSTAFQEWSSGNRETRGAYWSWLTDIPKRMPKPWVGALQSNLYHNKGNWINNGTPPKGVWPFAWRSIRTANLALLKLDEGFLIEATDEQRDLIAGQAYFFRAFHHFELIKHWSEMPYIDQYLLPDETNQDRMFEYNGRKGYQACTEKMVEDLDKAAALLPKSWDEVSAEKGRFTGRATWGAAMALKAKALLYAGSPLMNKQSGGAMEYDMDYMRRAAEAAYELIQSNQYRLLDFDEYTDNFYKFDGTLVWSDETIWQKLNTTTANQAGMGKRFTPKRFAGNNICMTPTQNLVDMFEMQATGLPSVELDPATGEPNHATGQAYAGSGYNPQDPWTGLDPRFYKGIIYDQQFYTNRQNAGDEFQFFIGGAEEVDPFIISCYVSKKFWALGSNKFDNPNPDNFTYATPYIRLAEIYLIYAEAVNEYTGPGGTVDGAGLTALDAVNVVRNRAQMPNVHADFSNDQNALRGRIRNERAVELFFENNRWYDIRRWYVGHLEQYKVLYRLRFPQDHSSFVREAIPGHKRVFENPKHYWVPVPRLETQKHEGFYQNPGW